MISSIAPAPRSRTKKPVVAGNLKDRTYSAFLGQIQRRYNAVAKEHQLFQTDATGLWEAYLKAFPAADRQYNNCNCCRRFVEAYGGLVIIHESGKTESLWDGLDADSPETVALRVLARRSRAARVVGPFLSKDKLLGNAVTGDWCHLHLTQRDALVHRSRVLTPGQAMAEKREDSKNVLHALDKYKESFVNQALGLLKSDAVYGSEKVLGQCQFLSDLHAAMRKNPQRRLNIVWRATANAPAGFCHPSSSMIGTLLDDLVAGVSFEDAARKFKAKMHPLQYQRPTAAPAAGNIAAAEQLVEKLGISASLVRRFARLNEIETFWSPETHPPKKAKPSTGVFAGVKAKEAPTFGAGAAWATPTPLVTTTWAKFERTVLREASEMRLYTPHRGNFTAIVTAADSSAPPILQWDNEARRNPFSTYVYAHRFDTDPGSDAYSWGLRGGAWVQVAGICQQPSQWHGGHFPQHSGGIIFILAGAKDSRTNQGNGLFPAILKSELHAVRATIEAFSKTAVIQGRDEASANGLSIGPNMGAGVRLLIKNQHGIVSAYNIDRFE